MQQLVLTGIKAFWPKNEKRTIFLGPWCFVDNHKHKSWHQKKFTIVSSPWKPAFKIKEVFGYCHRIYEELLPQLAESLNLIHRVSFPIRYWRVLIGPWLLEFIEIFCDRYKRVEKALELFPDLYTYVLPKEQCKLISFDRNDFQCGKINGDYYNLKLFSLVAYELCPRNIRVKEYKSESKIEMYSIRYDWKRKIFNRLIKTLDLFFKNPILLCDMYHLTPRDMLSLKLKGEFKAFGFLHFESMSMKRNYLSVKYSYELRKKIRLKRPAERFLSLLYKVLPDAIPICYIENYHLYRNSVICGKTINSVKIVGSAVGWYSDERFKFFVAEAAARGAKLIDFQHGGGYGLSLAVPSEKLSLEKDIFYTWGWNSKKAKNIKSLPSPHLSRLQNTYSARLDNILFVGMAMPKYQYRLHTALQSDDMPKYFEDKETFFKNLPEEIKNKFLYHPYFYDYGWKEVEVIKKVCSNIRLILKGKLTDWMKKVKLVVIDHPHTSFIEALTINVPCIFYWDHEVYLMRTEAEEYIRPLREASIIFKEPQSAAEKVREIFNDPMSWWLEGDVQKARRKFCDQYAYARKDWSKIWAEELKQLLREQQDR